MNTSFRQAMAWLHSWIGLLACWALYFIFLTGTLGYVQFEITRWMTPELPMAAPLNSPADSLSTAQSRLGKIAPDAIRWYITLPNSRYSSTLKIGWISPPVDGALHGKFTSRSIDPDTGGDAGYRARKTGGGRTLYRFHYRLHYMPKLLAYVLVSIVAMMMLIAMISGVVVHKRIFRDFFTLRLHKGPRSWLDGHNLLGVTALPFYLMITYSGLIMLMSVTLALAPKMTTGQSSASFEEHVLQDQAIQSTSVIGADSETPKAPMNASIAQLLGRAEKRLGKNNIAYLRIERMGDMAGQTAFYPRVGSAIASNANPVILDRQGVRQLTEKSLWSRAATQTHHVLTGMHEGLFAGPFLRFLYIIAGFSGAALIATGSILWLKKNRAKPGSHRRGLNLIERINSAVYIGLPIAIAAYFYANRLLPVALTNRAYWETNTLFIVWALVLIWALCRPAKTLYFSLNRLAGALFLLLPLLNLVSTQRHLGASLGHGDWSLASIDLGMLLIGGGFAGAAYRLQPHKSGPRAQTSGPVTS